MAKLNLTPVQQFRARKRLLALKPQLAYVTVTDEMIYRAIDSGVLTAAECDISQEQIDTFWEVQA